MAQAQALQEAHKAEPDSKPMVFEPMGPLPAFPDVPQAKADEGSAHNGGPGHEEPAVPDLAPLIASSSGYAPDVRFQPMHCSQLSLLRVRPGADLCCRTCCLANRMCKR